MIGPWTLYRICGKEKSVCPIYLARLKGFVGLYIDRCAPKPPNSELFKLFFLFIILVVYVVRTVKIMTCRIKLFVCLNRNSKNSFFKLRKRKKKFISWTYDEYYVNITSVVKHTWSFFFFLWKLVQTINGWLLFHLLFIIRNKLCDIIYCFFTFLLYRNLLINGTLIEFSFYSCFFQIFLL